MEEKIGFHGREMHPRPATWSFHEGSYAVHGTPKEPESFFGQYGRSRPKHQSNLGLMHPRSAGSRAAVACGPLADQLHACATGMSPAQVGGIFLNKDKGVINNVERGFFCPSGSRSDKSANPVKPNERTITEV